MSADATPKSFGFVVWPEPTEAMHYGPEESRPRSGIADTGEGGMECWLIARASRHYDDQPPRHVRDVCITGFVPAILEFDAAPDPWFQQEWAACQRRARPIIADPMPVDAAVCIGSTKRCPWDYRLHDFWRPGPGDLTDDGRKIIALMEHLYGAEAVHVVMVLDT